MKVVSGGGASGDGVTTGERGERGVRGEKTRTRRGRKGDFRVYSGYSRPYGVYGGYVFILSLPHLCNHSSPSSSSPSSFLFFLLPPSSMLHALSFPSFLLSSCLAYLSIFFPCLNLFKEEHRQMSQAMRIDLEEERGNRQREAHALKELRDAVETKAQEEQSEGHGLQNMLKSKELQLGPLKYDIKWFIYRPSLHTYGISEP
jgi:hypothetical protein